jgi:hypothetical protein
MRTPVRIVVVGALVLASSCGLELIAANFTHAANERPASKLTGTMLFPDAGIVVTDADGKALEPFQSTIGGGKYEVRLPSAKYSNLIVTSKLGNVTTRALVPSIGEESALEVNVDARAMTEALITEARLSNDKSTWKQVTPAAYLATRKLMSDAFDQPGPTQDLLHMVEHLLTTFGDPTSTSDPLFFSPPVVNPADFTMKTSPLDPNWIDRERPDLDGDGRSNGNSAVFDNKLIEVAKLYRPAGCPDPDRLRIIFTVDFNEGRKNGNCGASDRFKWATDKPGKSMFFVGWLHKDSPNQDPLVAALVGAGVPNQIPMKDDGTGGDETAGDNIWTVYFDVPRGARIGYKYTWGTRGAPWTGSEEWPGNSRIIEVVDVNGDDLVYRRDVFADEATNKDRSNGNTNGNGIVDWTTNLRGYGLEAREMMVDTNNDCVPDTWLQPKAVGPLTLACTQ